MSLPTVLVADPPWLFGTGHYQVQGQKKNTRQYPCMKLEDICKFQLPELNPDCMMFMWRCAGYVPEAYEVCKAWGFRPITEIVWNKKTVKGNPHFGMGWYVHSSHESCIIAARGKARNVPILDHTIRSVFDGPVGRHSEKPEEFFQLVQRMYAGPYAEIFARRRRPGWQCYGNELEP